MPPGVMTSTAMRLSHLEHPGRTEVVDLPGAVPRAPQLHRNRRRRAVAAGQAAGAAGAGEGEAAAAGGGHGSAGVARHVREVADAAEHVGAAGELEGFLAEVVGGGDRVAAAEREDDPLAVAAVEGVAPPGGSSSTRRAEWPQPAFSGVTSTA